MGCMGSIIFRGRFFTKMLLIEKDILKFAILKQVQSIQEKAKSGLTNQEFDKEYAKSVEYLSKEFNIAKVQMNELIGQIITKINN
jgi:hypothetical protein